MFRISNIAWNIWNIWSKLDFDGALTIDINDSTYQQHQQQQQHQMLRNQGLHPSNVPALGLGRFQNPAMNGVMPPNAQGGPPPTSANGPVAGIGRGMPPAPGSGPAGPSQTPMQSLHGIQGPPMPNGIGPGHGNSHPQPPMGQPQQPGQGANGASQPPPQQNPPGQPSPHNPQQQQQQQQSQQQHPPQPPPMQQHGPTPLGFPGPMPGPGAQQGQAPGQPNGIMGGPHHMQGHPGMNMAPRGSMQNLGLGVGRGAGGPQPGFHQSPTMAHANPNAPQPPPGQQHPGASNMPPPYPGMPGQMHGGMRPGMFPPQPPNGAGATTPGAMNAGTPGPAPGGAPGVNQQYGIPGGSRAATPSSSAGVGGSALPQRSPSMAAAAVGRVAGPVPGSAGAPAGAAGAGRGRVTKRNSVSPGDEVRSFSNQ